MPIHSPNKLISVEYPDTCACGQTMPPVDSLSLDSFGYKSMECKCCGRAYSYYHDLGVWSVDATGRKKQNLLAN